MAFDENQKAKRKEWIQLRVQKAIDDDIAAHKAAGTTPTLGGDGFAIAELAVQCILDNHDEFKDDALADTYVSTRKNEEAQKEEDDFKAKLEAKGYTVTKSK